MRASVLVAGSLALGFIGGRLSVTQRPADRTVTVLTRVDTVRVTQPEVVVVRALEPVREALPLAATRDTVFVEVPRVQAVYESPDFKAYVSGFKPALDSIEVYARHTTVRVPTVSRPRFSVGLQAGYGFTPRGFQPFIGVGISVSLVSF